MELGELYKDVEYQTNHKWRIHMIINNKRGAEAASLLYRALSTTAFCITYFLGLSTGEGTNLSLT